MSAVRWLVLALFLLGLHWPGLWIPALVVYELGVRRGRDVVALWLAGRVDRFRGEE